MNHQSTMASQEGSSQTINLKVLIDKKNNRVVMAEAESDFVDILFNFLTMPMGTIVRLISKHPEPANSGSLTSLYQWVENLDEQLLQNQACKSMLLHPKNPYEEEYGRKLKLNIDATKYYICADWNCSRENYGLFSAFKNDRCNCGKMMDREIRRNKEYVAGDGGVFVFGKSKFMVTDDLQVKSISPATIVTLLDKVGIKDKRSLQETTLNIGSEEILNLLKRSLFSKTPLTDVFVRKQGISTSEGLNFEIADAVQSKSSGSTLYRFPRDMSMKLMMSKSINKALYSEAGEDLVNFLLSFLTLPLGSILQLLGGNSLLGSMDNLYMSVAWSRITKTDTIRDLLLHPCLCRGSYNPLGLNEIDGQPDSLRCTSYQNPQNKDDNPYTAYLTTERQPDHGRTSECCKYLQLKFPPSGGGFLKGPANFMVTDNLVFKPLVSNWSHCLSFVTQFKVPLDDLEVREINVGREQALRLLKFYLFSKSVPTDALQAIFNFELKSPKQEE
ncbi:uncharacterized protein LOC122076614 [Macadamia integrifolia]|uniref:uncharacterized protein LOC122076614 n=1 Tax=Macadamia integrifolia TaxID=60698 RepID=UPI001C4F69BA|nr:uncharacterized protein LOC122076614 [Macadamia integrifolia]